MSGDTWGMVLGVTRVPSFPFSLNPDMWAWARPGRSEVAGLEQVNPIAEPQGEGAVHRPLPFVYQLH